MTRAEMRARLRTIIKRSSSAFEDSELNINLNFAQHWIAERWTFEEMEKVYEATLTADERLYNFPDEMKDIHSVRIMDDASSRKLTYMPEREFDRRYPDPTVPGSGIPFIYVDHGKFFELYKAPDDTYNIRVRTSQFPIDMDDDSSSSSLEYKDELMVAKAAEKSWRMIRELEDAEYWNAESERLLADSRAGDKSREDWDRVARPFISGGRGYISPTIPRLG